MTHAYQNLCDFLAIDPKNYTLPEFFTDLKLFCTFFSVSQSTASLTSFIHLLPPDLPSRDTRLARTSRSSSPNHVSPIPGASLTDPLEPRDDPHPRSSQNLMSSSQYFVRTSSRRFPKRSDSTDDFLLAAAESGSSSSRGNSPSNAFRRQVARIA